MFLTFISTLKLQAEASEGRIRRVEDARVRFQSIDVLEVYLLGRNIYLELILGAAHRLSGLE